VKRLLSVFFISLLLLLAKPAALFAKADTSKIIIKGPDLSAPIEITDPKTLASFDVWSGTGTTCTTASGESCAPPSTESFIVDWSHPMVGHPTGLHRYEVSFYAKMPDERLIYVVFYEFDPTIKQGYVYLPGRNEEWYQLNVSALIHGVEGKWLPAWSAWEDVARPLIAGAKAIARDHVQ
jgi:hypothetical protein